MNEFLSELFSDSNIEGLKTILLPIILPILVTLLTQYVINNKWAHIFSKKESRRLQIIKEFCPRSSVVNLKIPKSYQDTKKIFINFSYGKENVDSDENFLATEVSYQINSSFLFDTAVDKSVEILILNNKSSSLYTVKYFLFPDGMKCYINNSDYKYIEEGETAIFCFNKKYSPNKLILIGNGFINEFDLQKGNDEIYPIIKKMKKK